MMLKISELPVDVQQKIPISIRSYSDEYEVEDLPASIQTLLKSWLERTPTMDYNIAFDVLPQVSEYGDLSVIQNIVTLIGEYLKNYFMITPEDYPFDPYFGSRLKRYLQTKDTSLRQTLISNEIDNIVAALSADMNINIQVTEINIEPIVELAHTEYKLTLKISINNSTATISL